jgi:hypothetical protein
MCMRTLKLTINLKAYGVLHPSELTLDGNANIVENELPEEELT